MRIARTPVSERSAHVVADEPSTVTVSSAVVNSACAAPRITTLVSSPSSLTRTKPGRSRSPVAIKASSTSSKPAPSSTSAQIAATRAFSEGGSTTVACSPKMPNQSPGRKDRPADGAAAGSGSRHGRAPNFSSRLTRCRSES